MSDHESTPTNRGKGEDESAKPTTTSEENGVTVEKKHTDTATMNATTSEDSEYETMEEDNGRSASSRSSHSRRSSFSEDGDNLSDDLVLRDEREDGDGQEENSLAKDKKLDDDEDRRNPQYIPKKGTFYEHDDRTMMDENEVQNEEEDPNKKDKSEEVDKEQKSVKKGKVWTEKADRWTHDLYNEDEQKPKSTQELIDTYGYDIRNEEAPPKARRRRRYGRGPNKYTRNWEDEDAYTRSVPVQRRVFHNNREEFPDLNETSATRGPGPRRRDKEHGSEKTSPPKQTQSQPSQQPTGERERGLKRDQEKQKEDKHIERDKDRDKRERINPLMSKEPPSTSFSEKPLDKHLLPATANNQHLPIVMCPNNRLEKNKLEGEQRVGRGRGFRGTGKPRPTMEFIGSRGRVPPPVFNKDPVSPVQDSLKHAADMLVQDFSHIYVSNNNNNANSSINNSTNIVEETIIPRSERHNHSLHQGGGEPSSGGGRSKRYSTQRQRSLPETTPPPTYSPPHSIPYYTQPPPSSYVPAPVYNDVAPPPVTSPPIQMVAFLPPGPPPPAAAAPPYPPPPLLNYMPPPTYPPMALQPPPISGQFEELSQAAELYQSQGGITYYSTQTQSALPRPNPPRRVKLAIPIVPPPDKSGSKQRGSATGKQQEVQSAVS